MTNNMKLPIKGCCLCGVVSFEVKENPLRTGFCYCRSCQIKSGSGHVGLLAFDRGAINISGAVKWYGAVGGSGKPKQHGFCPECGTIMFGKPELWAHIVVVYVGSLNNPAEFSPEINNWTYDMQTWDCVNDKLTSYNKNPG